MWFFEGVIIAIQSIWANKLRSVLTLIGIIIGVTTLIAVVSVINGVNKYITSRIETLGSNTFIIDKEGLITSEEEWLRARKRKNITVEDMRAVARYCDLCENVGGTAEPSLTKVKYGADYLDDIWVVGATYNYIDISDVDIDYGRPLVESDDIHRSAVCLVGPDIVTNLMKYRSALGKDIKVGKYYFRIVGVGKSRGSFLGMNQDNWVVVPLSTYQKYFGKRRTISIYAKAKDMGLMEEAQDQARSILRARRKIHYNQKDDFGIMTTATFIELYNNLTATLWLVLVFVSSIALVVGGIVIMNIMLVSVTERTREVGIRKAIGARRRDILWQFLVEAATLAAVGGGIGILIGILFALVLDRVTPLPAAVELWAVVTGLAVASGVGIIFGLFPAVKAARLDPIESLRYE